MFWIVSSSCNHIQLEDSTLKAPDNIVVIVVIVSMLFVI